MGEESSGLEPCLETQAGRLGQEEEQRAVKCEETGKGDGKQAPGGGELEASEWAGESPSIFSHPAGEKGQKKQVAGFPL